MKRVSAVFGCLIIGLGLSAGALAHEGHEHKGSKEGKDVAVQGELIDSACFVASDGDAKGKDHADCAQKCMASGIPAAILPEGSKDSDAMMYLLTSPTALAPYAAQTIKVEGTAYEDKHAIDVKHLYVKQGNDWKEVQLKDEHHSMKDGEHAEHAAPASQDHAGHAH